MKTSSCCGGTNYIQLKTYPIEYYCSTCSITCTLEDTAESWEERMKRIAADLSNCHDIKPETLNKHRNAIYIACLDMIYHFGLELARQREEMVGKIENIETRHYDDFSDYKEQVINIIKEK